MKKEKEMNTSDDKIIESTSQNVSGSQCIKENSSSNTMNRKDYILLIIQIITIIMVLVNFMKDFIFKRDASIKENELKAVQYRPLLNVKENIIVKENEEKTAILTLPLKKYSISLTNNLSIDVPRTFEITCNLQNVGNGIATMVGSAVIIDSTEEQTIRKYIHNLSIGKKVDSIKIEWIKSLSNDVQILPGDSINAIQRISLPVDIPRIFYIHNVFFYKNDLGNLYDLYTILKIETNYSCKTTSMDTVFDTIRMSIHWKPNDKVTKILPAYKIYNGKETIIYNNKIRETHL